MPKRSEGLSEHFSAHAQALSAAIGARIRTRRLELNLSQERVRAQMELENVHVSRTQFSRVETGTILPNAAEIIALVKVLHVSSDWLLFGQAEPRHDKT